MLTLLSKSPGLTMQEMPPHPQKQSIDLPQHVGRASLLVSKSIMVSSLRNKLSGPIIS